jgi:superfamily II DNA or RNA helicase
MELRYYQKLAINQFNDHYYVKKNNRGILSMCCGSGKTLTFWSIIKNCMTNHNEKLFIYVTSRRLLVNDVIINIINSIYHDEIKNLDIMYKVSDFNNHKIQEKLFQMNPNDNKFKYQFYKHYKKYCFINPNDDEIINELKTRLNTKKILIITTYDSCDKFINAISSYNSNLDNIQINPNLIILDESHNIVSVNKTKRANSILEINDDKYFYPHKYLFMTATPLKIIKKNVNEEYHNDVIEYSMDNLSVYGDIFFEYSFFQGNLDGYVSDFEIIIPQNIDKDKYNDILKKSRDLIKDEKQNLYFKTIGELLNNAINKYNLKRTIVYLSQQEKINIFEKILKDLNIECYICHSNQSNYDRNNNIDSFIGKQNDTCKVLLSVDILNEGVDIPICDSVMFAEERSSETVIVQNIGRCLRLHVNKPKAYIIIPTYVYNTDENEIAIFSSKFKKIRYICDIMRNQNAKMYNRVTGVIRDKTNTNEKTNTEDNNDISSDSDIEQLYDEDWSNLKNDVDDLKNMIIENTTLISTDKNISNVTYEKFKKIVNHKNIMTLSELHNFIKSNGIPIDKPHIHFGHENKWICYGELLLDKIFTYDEAKKFIKTYFNYNIKSINDWTKEYNNLLSFALNGQMNYVMIDELIKIPNKPNKYYLSEWNNFSSDLLAWNDFLGTNIEINTNAKKEISGSEINADKNLSNLINTDHYKKIIKYVPAIKSSYNNWSIDLSDIIRYLNDKFKPFKCKISTIDFVADHNKKINSLFIKCNIISNDPFALIADYPIIINNLCKMSYDPDLLNDILFNNKLKSELKFTRSKSEYIKSFLNIIKMLMDEISENIEM